MAKKIRAQRREEDRKENEEFEARCEARRFKGIKLALEITKDVFPLTREQREAIRKVHESAADEIAKITGRKVELQSFDINWCTFTRAEYKERFNLPIAESGPALWKLYQEKEADARASRVINEKEHGDSQEQISGPQRVLG